MPSFVSALGLLSCVRSRPFRLRLQPLPLRQVGTSGQDSSNELFVAVGKSVLVDIARRFGRIAVGSGDIAEATP